MPQVVEEICQSCHREIGRDETPCLSKGKVVCAACWSIENNAPSPVSVATPPKIAGWLILAGIGLIVGPYISFSHGMVTVNSWVTFRSRHGIVADVDLLYGFVAVGHFLFAVAENVCAIAFFQKRRSTPALIVSLRSAGILFSFIVQVWVANTLTPTTSVKHYFGQSFISFVFSACWIAYFLRSKRVKAVFIR